MRVMLAHQLHESKILKRLAARIDGNYLLIDEFVVFFPSDSAMRPALQTGCRSLANQEQGTHHIQLIL